MCHTCRFNMQQCCLCKNNGRPASLFMQLANVQVPLSHVCRAEQYITIYHLSTITDHITGVSILGNIMHFCAKQCKTKLYSYTTSEILENAI